jgi:hypothetical protein
MAKVYQSLGCFVGRCVSEACEMTSQKAQPLGTYRCDRSPSLSGIEPIHGVRCHSGLGRREWVHAQHKGEEAYLPCGLSHEARRLNGLFITLRFQLSPWVKVWVEWYPERQTTRAEHHGGK